MTETPTNIAAAPETSLLADVLSRVRLTGALFLKGEYGAPWALESPASHDLMAMLAPGAERLIVFHIVTEGRMWVEAEGTRVELRAGDMGILPAAHRHAMGSLLPCAPRPIGELLPPAPWPDIPTCRLEGGGEPTRVVCGYFRCDEPLFNGLLRQLPPVFGVRPGGPTLDWMMATVGYALHRGAQPGEDALTARLPELLLVEALRLHAEQSARPDGWLAAIRDPVVGRALALLHRDPGHSWTVPELARLAATSRSVLGERFAQLLGISPMQYLAGWRMQIAADLLRTTRLKMHEIAERSGYGSEVAFSRAFSRHLGVAPGALRRAQD